MWEAAQTLVHKIPAWYWMIAIPVILFWVLPRIRRDKKGKLYIYSSIVEAEKQSARQQKYISTLEGITSRLDHVDAQIKQLETQSKCAVMENLKQSVAIDGLDITEKMYAGLRYIVTYGGNSATKRRTLDLIAKNKDIYKAIITAKPELALDTLDTGIVASITLPV